LDILAIFGVISMVKLQLFHDLIVLFEFFDLFSILADLTMHSFTYDLEFFLKLFPLKVIFRLQMLLSMISVMVSTIEASFPVKTIIVAHCSLEFCGGLWPLMGLFLFFEQKKTYFCKGILLKVQLIDTFRIKVDIC